MEVPLHEGFPVAPLSRARIREAAIHARRVLKLGDGRIDLPRLLDILSEYGIHYDVFDAASAPVPREVEACWVPEDRTLYIRDSVFDQMCCGGQRAVFTVGHELGHALLAHRRTLNRQTVADVPVYCNSEWQANFFSAEFTMPLEEILRCDLNTATKVSAHFGVSPKAAGIRLGDLTQKNELKKKALGRANVLGLSYERQGSGCTPLPATVSVERAPREYHSAVGRGGLLQP